MDPVTMHRVSPRRSACDRCRSHKLRCVRLYPNSNGTSAGGNPDVLMPCQRCLKAGAECHAANLTRKPSSAGHPVRHLSTSSGHSSSSYQQWPQVGDRQLKDFSIDLTTQSPPPSQGRKSSGPGSSKDASPPWQQIFAPPSSRSHLGSPKASHMMNNHNSNNDTRHERRVPEGPTSLLTPPASDKSQRTGTHTPSFDMNKVGLEGREFCAVSSLLHDSTRTPTHMLPYPTREPLVTTNYFDTTTATNVMVSQNLREQQMHLSTDDCLHRLSQLSSRLVMDFGKSNSSNMGGDMMSFVSPTTGAPAWHSDGTGVGANGAPTSYLSSTVSKLFESLQIFLETVERLRPCPDSSATSECSYSDQWDESDFVSTTGGQPIYTSSIIVDHAGAVGGAVGASAVDAHRSNAADGVASDPPRQLFDMPATLTMLTCYTWLLKGYEMVLSGIQDALTSQYRAQGLLKSLPPIFHGPGIGSFALDDHPDMQIEIVIHIGSQLLHRIEGILGINVVSERQPNGEDGQTDRREVLDTKSAAALLDIWFAKGGSETGAGDPCGRRVQIKRTVENIRRLLREYWRDVGGI